MDKLIDALTNVRGREEKKIEKQLYLEKRKSNMRQQTDFHPIKRR